MIMPVKHTLDLCSISKMPYEKGVEEEFCQVWKYLFQATDKRNYAIFTLLTQYYFFLPLNIAEQLKGGDLSMYMAHQRGISVVSSTWSI